MFSFRLSLFFLFKIEMKMNFFNLKELKMKIKNEIQKRKWKLKFKNEIENHFSLSLSIYIISLLNEKCQE